MFLSLLKTVFLSLTITSQISFINGQSTSTEQLETTSLTVTENGSITTDNEILLASDGDLDSLKGYRTASKSDLFEKNGWNWTRIMASGEPIIANGNVWPATNDEDADDCLILVTRNQLMWHCPSGDDASYERHILYRGTGRFRGVFSAPGTDRRRLWLLDSPMDHDTVKELDTVTGDILQTLTIDGTVDGHDVVRIDNTIFLVDTRNGHVVEFELPASAAPYTESSIEAGAKEVTEAGYVNIVKRHTGFTRKDHINNIAIHSDLIITNLHGGTNIKVKGPDGPKESPTRLSALLRSTPEIEGKELDFDNNGFKPITNVGSMCHGIAFWTDDATSEIKLISLDSKSGSMVSVVLTGHNEGNREVLWTPDLDHPVLTPPKGVAAMYNNGAKVFSKGLAVQGGVAYFAVSYARQPVLRQTVPETLLVAVDLPSKKELFVRIIRSNGLINQIVTKSHLGWAPQLPSELSTIEITLHGGGGKMVETCEDQKDKDVKDGFCEEFVSDRSKCRKTEKAELCCACRGGEKTRRPLMAGVLDGEVLKIDDHVTATATFLQNPTCLDKNGATKRISLEVKAMEHIKHIQNFDKDLNSIIKHICNLDVNPIAERLLELGDAVFMDDYQIKNGNAVVKGRKYVLDKIKPGTRSFQLIWSSKSVSDVYHFPWLDDWLPMIQKLVLDPIGVKPSSVIRMMFAQMPKESTINIHSDKNPWVQKGHRVHVPIITHKDVFFLTQTVRLPDEEDYDYDYEKEVKRRTLRIKSNPGEVYEFNNAMLHTVRNLGEGRIHLILDWIEDENYVLQKPNPGDRIR